MTPPEAAAPAGELLELLTHLDVAQRGLVVTYTADDGWQAFEPDRPLELLVEHLDELAAAHDRRDGWPLRQVS